MCHCREVASKEPQSQGQENELPIRRVLPGLLEALRGCNAAVLVAPPGAGKTTAVAPALLEEPWCTGTVILLSPRRIAARAAAERMAELLGEKAGETVGYLTRLDTTSARKVSDIQYHEGSVEPDEKQTLDGLPVVPLARAALESACLLDLEHALVVVDSALRSGRLTRSELEATYARMRHWPDTLVLQLVLRLADGRHGSVAETRVGYLLWTARVPQPVPQYAVYDGDEIVAYLDFAWPEFGLWLEFDGRVKYEKHLRPGESASDAVVREKKREDRIRELTGWRVIRITWEDLAHPEKLMARIHRAMRLAA